MCRDLQLCLRLLSFSSPSSSLCRHPNTHTHTLSLSLSHPVPYSLGTVRLVQEEHHLVVLCVKALMKHDYGFRKVVQERGFLDTIVGCFTSTNRRTRIAVMQIMAVVASNPSAGATRALDAFQLLAMQNGEQLRFALVVQQLETDSSDEEFSVACLTCFLSLINNAQDLNMLVFVQMDLARAGLDQVLPSLDAHFSDRVTGLVEEYRSKLLNVDAIVSSRDEQREYYLQASDQVKALQATLDDVTKQRDELRQMYKEAQIKSATLQDRLKVSRRDAEQLEENMQKMQDELKKQAQLIADQERQIKEVEEHAMRTVSVAALLHDNRRVFPSWRDATMCTFPL